MQNDTSSDKTELEKKCEALVAQNAEKTESIAIAAHQLRSPLSSIVLVNRMLLGEGGRNLTEEQLHLVKLADTAAGQMQELINDLLELEKLETSDLRTQAKMESLEQLLDETVAHAHAKIQEKNLRVEKQYGTATASIQFDYEKLQGAVANIIDNAIKYTPAGGVIELATEYGPGYVRMVIKDSGIGVPEDDVPNLFKKFIRMKNAKEAGIYGFGLGLYIAKKVVEKHNGTLEYRSNEPHGSAFIITIPTEL